MLLSQFPGAPAVLGLGKDGAEMKWQCADLASVRYDAWSEWNHSVKPFSSVMLAKTIADPNLHL